MNRKPVEAIRLGVLLQAIVIAPYVSASEQLTEAATPLRDGLVLWLDAGDTNGDSRTEGEFRPGTRLPLWRDKSGAGNHVRQAEQARQPVLVAQEIGTQRAVRFGASALERAQLSGFRSGDQRFQIFVVMRAALQHASNPRLLDLRTQPVSFDAAGRHFWKRRGFWLGYRDLANAAGKLRLGIHVGDEGQAREDAWNSTPQLLEAVYAGNQRWSLYQNGRPVGRGRFQGDNTFIGFEGGAQLAVGSRYGSDDAAHRFAGEIAEILIYNRGLTFGEQRHVGRYLTQKYGLETGYTTPVEEPRFETDILPILTAKCLDCHGAAIAEADLKLDTLADALRGGASGPVIRRHQACDSLLLSLIATNVMPPADSGEPLSDREVELVRQWIDAGAPADQSLDLPVTSPATAPGHWSFQRLAPPLIPRVWNGGRARTAVDAFALAQLEAKRLRFSADAQPATLIRRAYLDLLGLLPTPEQVKRFAESSEPQAWQRLVDQLLESPHFGERWGRHWLDGAGFTDTIPTDNDQTIIKPGLGKWKYRDYVVKSLNEDKPYGQFLTEQLAGDEMVAWRDARRLDRQLREKLIATGFLRCSPDVTDASELNTLITRYAILHRTSETVAQNLLGLTLQCCRCHDHKFEPLPQRDYYRFTAILAPALNPNDWLQPGQRQLSGLGSAEQAEIDERVEQFTRRRQELRDRAEHRLLAQLVAAVPPERRTAFKAALQLPAAQRSPTQRKLIEQFSATDQEWTQQVLNSFTAEEQEIDEQCAAGIQRLNEQRRAATIQAVYDGRVSPVYVLHRGDCESPRATVEPGLFRVLADDGGSISAPAVAGSMTSGRRLALARRLTDWSSPAGALAARVRVNRVWQQLFGRGLVETADNFGLSGGRPTHPQLLEWLAAYFVEHDGRLKPLLRLLMTSTVYQQAARSSGLTSNAKLGVANPRRVDPTNSLLWRQRLRRLESEIVRDSMLSASGRLDPALGGPPADIENLPDGRVIEAGSLQDPPQQQSWRRSLYLLQRRNYHLSLLAAFDQPLLTSNCVQRETSTVVSQSLTMLNDRFVLRQAEYVAERAQRASSDCTTERQIETAFQLILARGPSAAEMQWCAAAYAQHATEFREAGRQPRQSQFQALVQICHMLFNTSEFLYVH